MSTRSKSRDGRSKVMLAGLAVILGLGVLLITISLGRYLPGELGRYFGVLSGILSTPFLMETCLFLLGLATLFAVNHWRDKRDGDEFVFLEQAEGPGVEKLPASARSVIYADAPLEAGQPDLLTMAEGAMEIGDHDQVSELIAQMGETQRDSSEVKSLRIRLARATGREDLARRLESE